MKYINNAAFVTLVVLLALLTDIKKEFTAERVESVLITANDEYYVHFTDWIYKGALDVTPGERVLVITKRSRLTGYVYEREIHESFKIR